MKQSSFWKKGGFVLPAILILAGFFVFETWAYDPRGAHRALTYEMGEFYNLNMGLDSRLRGNDRGGGNPSTSLGEKLSEEEIEWLMQGAEEEDTPPKWINHFYNPDTGEGWVADKLGTIPQELLQWFSKFALSARSPISAKNWAKNRSAQNDYYLYGGDQTWQRAIELYASGDKKAGLITLGHTLHLLEDMTVPDHSRNDTHAGLAGDIGSSLETYAKDLVGGNTKGLKIAENLKQSGTKPLNLPNLENYFDANAKYSHDNFFSDDTINDKNFPIPDTEKIVNENKQVMVYVKNKDSYPLYTFKDDKEIIKDDFIMSAYWERLSKQAVISGAGAIQLFFKEVEEYKELHKEIPLNPPSPKGEGGTFSILRGGVISPFGELVKLNKKIVQTITGVQNFVTQFLPKGGKSAVVEIEELESGKKETAGDPTSKTKNKELQEVGSLPTSGTGDGKLQEVGSPGAGTTGDRTPNTNTKTLGSPAAAQEVGSLYVSHVIDGDTVTLNNGKDVRLIGMDTPEAGDECAAEARQKLSELLLGQYVRLEKDKSETDKYNRLLRYVYIDNVMINAEMVLRGFAKPMSIFPDTKFVQAFKIAENEAKFFKRGCLYGGVGGAGDDEIHNPSQPPLILRGGEDRGLYYGGSSYASNPERPGQNNTIGFPEPYSSASSTTGSAEITSAPNGSPSTNSVINNVTSTPETATSTPQTSTTSTPETATSTPEIIITSINNGTSSTSSDSNLTSPTATSTPEAATSTPSQDKILISEIQLAGQTADDEFIELYNPNNKIVSLAGWSIQYRGSSAASFAKKNFLDVAEIPAYGFYLIGHKNYSSSGTADMTHSTFALSATGGTIFLVRGQEKLVVGNEADISDKVAYYNGTPPPPAALFPETIPIEIVALQLTGSMERKSNSSSTAETMARGGINETDGNSRDAGHNQNDFVIRETPNPQNTQSPPEDPTNQHYPPEPEAEDEEDAGSDESEFESDGTETDGSNPSAYEPTICVVPTYDNHNKSQPFRNSVDRSKNGLKDFPYPIYKNASTILTKGTTYYVDDSVYIPSSARLIIEEGVVLKFGRWRRSGSCSCDMPIGFRVDGSLEVNGTKANPVVFTTFRDDANGLSIDLSGTNPMPGDWGSLQIESGAAETIKITGAKFYYGGGTIDGANAASGVIFINMSGAQIDISDAGIYESESGIYFRPKPGSAAIQPSISGTVFEYNKIWGIVAGENSAIRITGSTFRCNGLSRNSGTTGGVNIVGDPSSIIIEGNNFLGNENTGLYYYNKKNVPALLAPNNFWNAASGPTHDKNSAGTGDKIIGNVNFSPFAASKR